MYLVKNKNTLTFTLIYPKKCVAYEHIIYNYLRVYTNINSFNPFIFLI